MGSQFVEGEITYIPGSGLFVDGEPLAKDGELTYIEGDGIYVNGERVLVETGTTEIMVTATTDGGLVTETPVKGISLLTVPTWEAQVLAGTGEYQLAYNGETKQYEVVTTETLLGHTNKVGGGSGNQNDLDAALEKLAQENNSPSGLTIGQGIGKNLTQAEERGFTLLIFAGIAVAGILIFLYFRLRKRDN